MELVRAPERVETVIVGGGQAGLATAYHLQRRNRPFVILDANQRVGDSWRRRWDSLRLFTPARLSHLPGVRYPGGSWTFPTKDEFADYLEQYAARFEFDVRSGMRVREIKRHGDRYWVTTGQECFEAEHVVLATGAFQRPNVPAYAREFDPKIVQLHSNAYRNPSQLEDGGVLVVGAANSGAEIALDLAGSRDVWLAGPNVPVFPVRPERLPARVVMPAFLFVATHVLTLSTPVGRRARPYIRSHAAPLIRVKPSDLSNAGVHRVGRVVGARNGCPELEDGTVFDVANVVWCTGGAPDFSWIDLPAFASADEPAHKRGVLIEEPGMYMIGQLFQYALSSTFIRGVGRDAKHVAGVIAKRAQERERTAARSRRVPGFRSNAGRE